MLDFFLSLKRAGAGGEMYLALKDPFKNLNNQNGRIRPVWIGLAVIVAGLFINKWVVWAGVGVLVMVFISAYFHYRSLSGD